ncbi:MAG TPA: hypothetical protein VHE61_01425 [Opitutaceae bacterium]|nr:hypothetical protein [Opitutaceae bacterium]
MPPERVEIRTLLRHTDVPMMIANWRTLIACCADPFGTVVHDDGSLTDEDRESLVRSLPNTRILDRADADDRMAESLARFRHAEAFRRSSVWGLKLLDVVLAEPGDCFYLDGDIRFRRRFGGLFRADIPRGRCVFLRDPVWTAYSVRPWHLLGPRRLRLVDGINTGLTLIDRACFDLEFVDWFLAQPAWRVVPAWVEPTCWAALAERANGHAVSPRQIVNLYPRSRVDSETIGVHLLSSYRALFSTLAAGEPDLTLPARPVELVGLGRLGAVALGWNQLRRKWQNERARRRPATGR